MIYFNLAPDYLAKYYSCDALPYSEWAKEAEPDVLLGSIYLFIGFLFLFLYTLVIFAITKKEVLANNFYKLILGIAIADIVSLSCSAICCGYLTVVGSVYCMRPVFTYMVSEFIMVSWGVQSILTISLAFNRCLEVFNKKYADFLFANNRIYIWIIFAAIYALLLGFLTPAILYSSKEKTVFYDPYFAISKIAPTTHVYENAEMAINNVIVCIALPSLYFILCAKLLQQSRIGDQTKNLIIQSMLLSSMMFLASSSYVVMQYIVPSSFVIKLSHLFWVFSSCASVFVYLIFNETIKKHIISDFMPFWVQKYFAETTTQVIVVQSTHVA
uniref:Serpentine Receptor, class T n=1 Tax=Rhabditophanes sp. KR3021 TaxID=114890 RepID=A0AC35TY36_9BILA